MPGLQSSVLTGRALTVVPVTDNDPLDAVLLVITGNSRDSVIFSGKRVLDLVSLATVSTDGANQHVVGDVVKMSTVLQPRTGHRDVIGGSLANSLDENGNLFNVLSVPSLERLEELQTVRSRRHGNIDGGAVLRRRLVRVLAWVIPASGQTIASGLLQLEFGAVRGGKLVGLYKVRIRSRKDYKLPQGTLCKVQRVKDQLLTSD